MPRPRSAADDSHSPGRLIFAANGSPVETASSAPHARPLKPLRRSQLQGKKHFSNAPGHCILASVPAVRGDVRSQGVQQSGAVVWLTGLSGSGKSTLATTLERRLPGEAGVSCVVLDGDVVRRGLCSNLGYSREDRAENVRRVAEVAALFARAGLVCITALISPYAVDRALARTIVGQRSSAPFLEVFVDAPLACCQDRDPKGMYRDARRGAIALFTGISDVYEPPENPDIAVQTHLAPVDACAALVIQQVLRALGPHPS